MRRINPFQSYYLAAIAIVCVLIDCSCGSKPEGEICITIRKFLNYAKARDYANLRLLIHPNSLKYFDRNGHRITLEAYMNSIVSKVPENEDIGELDIVIFKLDDIKNSYGDRLFYDLIPDRGSMDVMEVKFRYMSGNTQRAEALFVSKYDHAFRIVVPDVKTIWGLKTSGGMNRSDR